MSDADRTPPASPTVYEARFIDTATSTVDEVRVVIDSYDDGEHAHGPVSWGPRVSDAGNAVYPAESDWALVTESDLGTWAVIAWAPAALAP